MDASRIKVEVPPMNEWRIESSNNCTITLKLESGTAEIFGTELSPSITYVFKNSMKFAVASYHGCELSYTSSVPLDSEYISEETILKQVLNLHLGLENFAKNGKSPKVLIVGPKDSGKTSLARILASYSLKTSEKEPILVNLDPLIPHFSISTQLTAAKLHDLLDIETFTIAESLTTGPGNDIYRYQIPLVKNFGLENFNDNLELYKCLISELSYEIDSKILNPVSNSGSVIIDTPALNVSNWKLIQHIVDSFKIDVLLVVGNERLLVDLRKKLTLPNDFIMLKMPRSSGSVEKESKYERDLQQRSVKQYFYGIERAQLNPYTFHCSVKDFICLRPNEQDISNMQYLDFMNGDADDNDDNYPSHTKNKDESDDDDYNPSSNENTKKIRKVKRDWNYNEMFTKIDDPKEKDLKNAVISIVDEKGIDMTKLMSDKTNEKDKLELLSKHATMSTVRGFAYVSNFDENSGKMKLIIPSPVKNLPGKIIIVTQMRYME